VNVLDSESLDYYDVKVKKREITRAEVGVEVGAEVAAAAIEGGSTKLKLKMMSHCIANRHLETSEFEQQNEF